MVFCDKSTRATGVLKRVRLSVRSSQVMCRRQALYSLVLLLRCASISRFSSSGVSFGRSIVSVSFASLPVNRNGTW
jgi:hypothetical protein